MCAEMNFFNIYIRTSSSRSFLLLLLRLLFMNTNIIHSSYVYRKMLYKIFLKLIEEVYR